MGYDRMEQKVKLSRICRAKILSQASPNLILESIIWQFYFLNVRPFLPRDFFTFLVVVAHGASLLMKNVKLDIINKIS